MKVSIIWIIVIAAVIWFFAKKSQPLQVQHTVDTAGLLDDVITKMRNRG